MLLTCELSIPVADLEGGSECVSAWSGVTLDLGFEDNCTSTGGAFTGGRQGRRKNLILVILSKSEASCSSASKTSDFSSLSSVIRSAIFLSRSHKISFFRCSCSRVFVSKTASSSLKGVVGSPRGVRHRWKSRTLAQKSLEITTEIIGNQEIRLRARNLE